MTMRRLAAMMALALTAGACSRSDIADAETAQPAVGTVLESVQLTVAKDVMWINSGITIRRGTVVRISAGTPSGDPPLGSPIPNARAPLPMAGQDALIGRVGRDGFPFLIGADYAFHGSSLNEGAELFLGRNVAPPEPFVDEVTDQSAENVTGETLAAEIAVVDYTSEDYSVRVRVETTDAPAPLTPIDAFYDSNPNPIFDWDEIDNAAQYTLDISDFPDFRRITFSINVATTSINTAAIGIDPTNPAAPVTPNLQEGVYYWRVRAQVNRGRLLTPVLEWTERSTPQRMGVETEAALPAPEVLTPGKEDLDVNAGSIVPFEIIATPDASGLTWRYRFFSAPCDEVIDPAADTIAVLGSRWMVFQQTMQTNRIDQPRQLYGAFVSPVLTEGEWLVRIETRDGADRLGNRLGVKDYRFRAGCR